MQINAIYGYTKLTNNEFFRPELKLETRERELRVLKKNGTEIKITELENNKIEITQNNIITETLENKDGLAEELTSDLIHKQGFEFTNRTYLSTTITHEAWCYARLSENYDLCNKILFQEPNPEPSKHLQERMDKAITAIFNQTLEDFRLIAYIQKLESWQQENLKNAIEEEITEVVGSQGRCYTHGLDNVRDNLYVTYSFDGTPFYMCEDCRHMEGGF